MQTRTDTLVPALFRLSHGSTGLDARAQHSACYQPTTVGCSASPQQRSITFTQTLRLHGTHLQDDYTLTNYYSRAYQACAKYNTTVHPCTHHPHSIGSPLQRRPRTLARILLIRIRQPLPPRLRCTHGPTLGPAADGHCANRRRAPPRILARVHYRARRQSVGTSELLVGIGRTLLQRWAAEGNPIGVGEELVAEGLPRIERRRRGAGNGGRSERSCLGVELERRRLRTPRGPVGRLAAWNA